MATSPRSLGRGDDRPGQRVLAVGLDAAGEAQHLGLVEAVAAATPVTTCAPLVSVPVLSNSTVSIVRIRSRARRSLTRIPSRAATAVDSEITSGIASPRACGQAITSTVTVRTMASSTSPSSRPHDERDRRRRRRRRRTAARRTGRRAPGPGCGWPGRRRRGAGCPASAVSSPTASTRTRIDESVDTVPATTRSPATLGDRLGLAGDHRLVELGLAVDDRAVGRDPAAGPHQHDVADAQLVDRHRADVVAVDDLGVVGQQLGQRRERAAGLADRLHLLPVPEQHDRHQRRQLPPELEVEPVEAASPSTPRRRR